MKPVFDKNIDTNINHTIINGNIVQLVNQDSLKTKNIDFINSNQLEQ